MNVLFPSRDGRSLEFCEPVARLPPGRVPAAVTGVWLDHKALEKGRTPDSSCAVMLAQTQAPDP